MARILAIDDDAGVGVLLNEFLSQMGHAVTIANNGAKGLAEAKLNTPDLIILDVDMPELNGYEVCKRLRAEPATQKTPILMLTGRSTLDDAMEGLATGADDHLAKPFDINEVASRVKALLAQRR